jgi:p21-activated kinase 1
MPQEWQKLLDDNGITRAEQEQNPDKVRHILICRTVRQKLMA